jgi:ubiquinone/menaquinone biosynthesis C-methylase UbiE
MKLTIQEQQTLDAYNKNAAIFAETRNKKRTWIKEKEKLRQYLPSGKILDIGSGSGKHTNDLMNMGYEYIGIEVSEKLIKEAEKYFPKATFLLQSVYELNFPEDTFDGFWACAILLHLPKARIDEALKCIYKVIKNEGIGFISLKKGKGEKFVEGDHYGINYKRFFSFWQENEFKKVLHTNNFEVLESYELEYSNKRWLAFFVKVNKK